MWRYHPVLPAERTEAVTLGEGSARFVRAGSLGAVLRSEDLWIVDDGGNPTGSCEARGASVAVSAARKLGRKQLRAAAGGNAGSALAAYGAAGGIAIELRLASSATEPQFAEFLAYGTRVTVTQQAARERDRFMEGCRIEGLKTAGYEIGQRFSWELPAAVICPCGDGAALMALWKAFLELEQIGWLKGEKPKMFAVQADGCAPVVKAFEEEAEDCERWQNPYTAINELRVAEPVGAFLILRILRASGGKAVAVSDGQVLDGTLLMAEREGVLPALEGGACVAAARHLLETGVLRRSERIVLYNPASGLKSLEALGRRFPGGGLGEQDKLGGLILPR